MTFLRPSLIEKSSYFFFEGSCIYSLRLRTKLCPLIGVRSLRWNNPPLLCLIIYSWSTYVLRNNICFMLYDEQSACMLFMLPFTLTLWWARAQVLDICKIQGWPWVPPHLGPLIWKCPKPRALPSTNEIIRMIVLKSLNENKRHKRCVIVVTSRILSIVE
jgi:hypothetical protein